MNFTFLHVQNWLKTSLHQQLTGINQSEICQLKWVWNNVLFPVISDKLRSYFPETSELHSTAQQILKSLNQNKSMF